VSRRHHRIPQHNTIATSSLGATATGLSLNVTTAAFPNPDFFLDVALSPPSSSTPHHSHRPCPAALCSSASQVLTVDVPLSTNFGSSISINLSLIQTQT
jgi:hypothetical protein